MSEGTGETVQLSCLGKRKREETPQKLIEKGERHVF